MKEGQVRFFLCVPSVLLFLLSLFADFRSFMAIYHMLFQDREMFMKALEKEGKDNKAKPKKERTNFTRDFIMTAFSEFFIYTAECGNSEWIKVVETKIKWTEFRENTLKSADYMRKCARFADAPRVRNWMNLEKTKSLPDTHFFPRETS